MFEFLIFLLKVLMAYLGIFLFWSGVKGMSKLTDRIVFCQTCFTFASIFIYLLAYYFYSGIQVLPLQFLLGLTATGIAYKMNMETDKNKEKIKNLEEEGEVSITEIFYTTRLFWFEIAALIIGLVIIKTGGL